MKKHINKDSFSAREAAKYDNPIPSREYILDFLSKSAGPLTYEELCADFGIQDDDAREALRRRLIAMERDGQTIKNRRQAELLGILKVLVSWCQLMAGEIYSFPAGKCGECWTVTKSWFELPEPTAVADKKRPLLRWLSIELIRW